MFALLRNRIQDFIDRRIFRRKYGAQQALAGFAQTARNAVELDTLTAEMTRVVQETIQPERLSIWLREQTR